jgi:hypothetical protein
VEVLVISERHMRIHVAFGGTSSPELDRKDEGELVDRRHVVDPLGW